MDRPREKNETIMVVEPNSVLRSRIVQAATFEKMVARTVSSSSLYETLKLLRNKWRSDIVFVSNWFGQREVLHFISAAKNTRWGQDCAFILLLDDQHQDRATVAKHLLKGMDGFLAASFTVETVQKIIGVALKVKAQRMQWRVETASRLMLEKLMDDLDHLTHDVTYRGATFVFPEGVAQAARVFRSFEAEEVSVYFRVLIDVFANVRPPVPFVSFDMPIDRPVFHEVPEQFEPFLQSLRDKDWRTRIVTLDKIALMSTEAAPLISIITECLEDSRAACRSRAVKALMAIDTPEARQALKHHEQKRKSRT